ncbi:MAG: trypsin-like peptidase domain-containing protein, partial [Nocardioides sp.]
MTDRPPEHSSDWDDTAPLGPQSWMPPTNQPPPAWQQQQRAAYPPPGAPLTQPMPAYAQPTSHRGRRGGTSRWIWPAVCVLALVVGGIGGAVGGAAYDHLTSDSDTGGRVSGGLEEAGATNTAPLPVQNGSVAAVAQQVLPSTVQILAQYQGTVDGATGSGFVLDSSGHFVTNNHVVADAAENDGPIEVVDQDGNRYDATVVGRSPTYDLAVLFVEKGPDLPPAALGASESMHVGDPVVAFGSPLGLSSTVTAGIISALNRPVTTGDSTNESSYINAVQTDAAINPGNSGGPLLNARGEVVGINTAIYTDSRQAGNIGIGFAIPINAVRELIPQLRSGKVSRGVIGVSVSAVPADALAEFGLTERKGALIGTVTRGAAASKAG